MTARLIAAVIGFAAGVLGTAILVGLVAASYTALYGVIVAHPYLVGAGGLFFAVHAVARS